MDKEFAEAFKEEIEKEASTYRDKAKMMKRRKRNTLLSEEKRKVVTVSLDTLKVKKWIENSQKHSKKKLKKEK